MRAPLPDRAILDAAQRRTEEDRAFWNAHRADLTARYPDEFIAINHGKVVDHDLDLMVLASRLQDCDTEMTEISIKFAATEPEQYIL